VDDWTFNIAYYDADVNDVSAPATALAASSMTSVKTTVCPIHSSDNLYLCTVNIEILHANKACITHSFKFHTYLATYTLSIPVANSLQTSLVGCVAQWKNIGYSPANFPVLRLTCSWRVTTYVDRPSAVGRPTKQTQPLIISGSINWVVSWHLVCATLLRWRHLVNAYEVTAGV